MNCYVSGEFWIERGEYGYHHGLAWALWGTVTDEHGTCKMVLDTDKTLKRLQRNALAEHGIPVDSWKREKVVVQWVAERNEKECAL